MCVDLSSRDVGVAEERLDRAKIGAVHEEIGGKRVPQSVWADMLSNAGHAGVFFDDAFDASWSESSEIAGSVGGLLIFAVVEKKCREGIAASAEVFVDAIGGGFGDEDWTVLLAFSADHEFAAFEVDGITI